MKDLSLLAWLTQLGFSVAVPLAAFIFLAVWLRQTFELGIWILFVGVFLGFYCAVHGFIRNMKMLGRINREKKKESPSVFFNDHH